METPEAKLLTDLILRLTRGEASPSPDYEVYGTQVTDRWGSAQWVKYVDPEGKDHYLRVQVIRNE
jgi:hypothetical protein